MGKKGGRTISRILSAYLLADRRAAIHLGEASPPLSSDSQRRSRSTTIMPLLFLLQIGFVTAFSFLKVGRILTGISPALHSISRNGAGIFSVTLSVALQPPAFRWYLLLRSPDFPLPQPYYGDVAAAACPSTKYFLYFGAVVERRLRCFVATTLSSKALLSCQ